MADAQSRSIERVLSCFAQLQQNFLTVPMPTATPSPTRHARWSEFIQMRCVVTPRSTISTKTRTGTRPAVLTYVVNKVRKSNATVGRFSNTWTTLLGSNARDHPHVRCAHQIRFHQAKYRRQFKCFPNESMTHAMALFAAPTRSSGLSHIPTGRDRGRTGGGGYYGSPHYCSMAPGYCHLVIMDV